MLPRAPECFFTDGDVALISKETGLNTALIQNWAKCLRWRMKNNLFGLGIASVEDYLKASEDNLAAQVMLLFIWRLVTPTWCHGKLNP